MGGIGRKVLDSVGVLVDRAVPESMDRVFDLLPGLESLKERFRAVLEAMDQVGDEEVASEYIAALLPRAGGLINSGMSDEEKMGVLYDLVFTDPNIAAAHSSQIHRMNTCGKVVNELCERLNINRRLQVLVAGDIRLPDWCRPMVEAFERRAKRIEADYIREHGTGYDLSGRGFGRERVVPFFLDECGLKLEEDLVQRLIDNAVITAGCSTALLAFFTGEVDRALKDVERGDLDGMRVIMPDNSFEPVQDLVNDFARGRAGIQAHILETTVEDRLHATGRTVDEFYRTQGASERIRDVWYFVPEGNPSGTTVKPMDLKATCERIIAHQPDAVIVLDCVLVRTLSDKKRRELMSVVFASPAVSERVIFIDSYSKPEGLCGLRGGFASSANGELMKPLQSVNMKWNGNAPFSVCALGQAVAELGPEFSETKDRLHDLWRRRRASLYRYLIENQRFEHLFDQDQRHLLVDDEEEGGLKANLRGGLILTLRLSEGVDAKQVAVETGILGKEVGMAGGRYLRFAVAAF